MTHSYEVFIGQFLRRLSMAAAVILLMQATVAMLCSGQTPATGSSAAGQAGSPTFDVATIRQNKDGGGRSHVYSNPHDSHFTAINVPLQILLPFAFGAPYDRILGLPGSLTSVRFDIEAKADSKTDEQMSKLDSEDGKERKRQMLQALLADRFELKFHREIGTFPVYELVVAKSGPKLVASKTDGKQYNMSNGHIDIHGGPSVAVLAEEISKQVGRIVVDKTGLDGRYDIDLKWTPQDNSAPVTSAASIDANAASGPSIFTALQEQLGLKLESAKRPVDVIVIDHIEQPSPN